MVREISRLRDFVIRLEFCVNVQKDQTVDLKSKSLLNIVIITGLQEIQDVKEPVNLAEIIRNIFIHFVIEMEMAQEDTDNLQIFKIFRMGEFDRNEISKTSMHQISNKIYKDMAMNRVSCLKKKQSPFRFALQQPEEIREQKKQLYEIPKKYSEKNIYTKVKGDKALFYAK